MEEKKLSFKKIILLILLLIIVIFIVLAIIIDRKEEKTYIVPDFTYDDIDYKKKDNIDIVFFTGIDTYDRYTKEQYRNTYASDAIIMYVIDNDAKTITPLYINSELMCKYNVVGVGGQTVDVDYGPAYLVHTYGSGDLDSLINVKNSISDLLTGISIEYYLSISMNAVPVVNDELGYVDVYVKDDFSNIDPSIKQNEVNTLVGEQALTFVKSKTNVGDGTSISRMNRQEDYIRALNKKIVNLFKEDENVIANIFNSIGKYIVSNSDIYELIDITNTFIEYDVLEPIFIKGKLEKQDDGTMQYIIKEEEIVPICINYFYDVIPE